MYDYLRCRQVAVMMYIKSRFGSRLGADLRQTHCWNF